MKVYDRVCIKTHTIAAQNGDSMTVNRGERYTTSRESSGEVTVLSRFWGKFPVAVFAGEEEMFR